MKEDTELAVEEREGLGLCVLLDDIWQPAIWHHELAASLDKEVYGAHLYNIEPPRRSESQAPKDITTYLSHQKSWGFESREHQPAIIFQLYPSNDRSANKLGSIPWLKFEIDGVVRVVLDILSFRPLRDFENVPLQLATNVEGGRLEAMSREDFRIRNGDFLQRMIPLLDENGMPQLDDRGVIQSERPTSIALNNAKTRFRYRWRCLSWNTTTHDSEFDKRLLNDITEEDKAANSTQNLPGLSSAELTKIRSLAKGRQAKATEPNECDGGRAAAQSATSADGGKESLKLMADCESQQNSQTSFDLNTERCARSSWSRQLDCGSSLSTPKTGTDEIKAPSYVPAKDDSEGASDPVGLARSALATQLPPIPQTCADQTVQTNSPILGSTLIDPVLTAADATIHFTDIQAPLQIQEINIQPHNEAPSDLDLHISAETREVVSGRDSPSLKRKRDDSDKPQLSDGSNLSTISPKRQKSLLPSKDPEEMLNDFSAARKLQISKSSSESLQSLCPFSTDPSSNSSSTVRRRSESPQPCVGSDERPVQPNPSPLGRPKPYSPVLSWPIPHHEHVRIIKAEKEQFALVSRRISSLDTLKEELMKEWWRSQVDVSSGGGLYGPKLNISLSQLGPSTSARTNAETRSLMSSFNIPAHYSASSVDVRQNPVLYQAVHAALCEAERWDLRNYQPAFPYDLNLDREPAFFLALASPGSIKPGDTRFTHSTYSSLAASLHPTTSRYRQLTGRPYPIPLPLPNSHPNPLTYHEIWSDIRRQVFLPYFLRFADPVEAASWMPDLGFLPPPGQHIQSQSPVPNNVDLDYAAAVDPRRLGCAWGRRGKGPQPRARRGGAGDKQSQNLDVNVNGPPKEKICLPLVCVDLEGM